MAGQPGRRVQIVQQWDLASPPHVVVQRLARVRPQQHQRIGTAVKLFDRLAQLTLRAPDGQLP
jgi:hypothetical protein